MNISSQGFTTQFRNNLQTLQNNSNKWLTQLETGHSIESPSESPITASCLLQIQTSRSELGQCQKNIAYAKSLTETAHSCIESLNRINTDFSTYPIQLSELNQDAVVAMSSNVNGLLEQSLQVVNEQYMGHFMLSGSKLDTQPFTVDRDADGKIVKIYYQGSGAQEDENKIPISSSISINPSTSGSENEQILKVLNRFLEFRNAFDQNDKSAIQSIGKEIIKDNETILVNIMGSLSAKITQTDHAFSQNDHILSNLEQLSSQYSDVDYPDIITRFQQSQYAYQAALQAGGKILTLSLLNYL